MDVSDSTRHEHDARSRSFATVRDPEVAEESRLESLNAFGAVPEAQAELPSGSGQTTWARYDVNVNHPNSIPESSSLFPALMSELLEVIRKHEPEIRRRFADVYWKWRYDERTSALRDSSKLKAFFHRRVATVWDGLSLKGLCRQEGAQRLRKLAT
jgi:hypothetical protein